MKKCHLDIHTGQPKKRKQKKNPKCTHVVFRNAKRYEDDLRKHTSVNMGLEEMSLVMQVCKESIRRWCRILDIPIHQNRKRKKPDEKLVSRAKEFYELRKQGKTLDFIANVFGITRERVRQVLAVTYPDIAFPGVGKKQHPCEKCGKPYIRMMDKQRTCLDPCLPIARILESTFTRDNALRIMELRRNGATWEAVTNELAPNAHYPTFRSLLQKYTKRIFSAAEREEFFPTKGTHHYRPSEPSA